MSLLCRLQNQSRLDYNDGNGEIFSDEMNNDWTVIATVWLAEREFRKRTVCWEFPLVGVSKVETGSTYLLEGEEKNDWFGFKFTHLGAQ